MATKSENRGPAVRKPRTKTTKKLSTAAQADHPAAPIDRRKLVSMEAYFLAERRGFQGGNAVEDWVTAERVVDSRLQQNQMA